MNDICHICLEEKDYQSNELIKDCCNAFICNGCWNAIINNETVENCPICSFEIETNINDIIKNDTIINENRYKLYIYKLSMVIKWLLTGYIITNLVLMVVFHDKEKYLNMMDFLNKLPYFWPLCILYGYCFVVFYEYYSNRICQSWYQP